MIKIDMTLDWMGMGRHHTQLASITIWTEPDNMHHGYRINFLDGREIWGELVKKQSAHQNILHVLREILVDADIDALGVDYIKRGGIEMET